MPNDKQVLRQFDIEAIERNRGSNAKPGEGRMMRDELGRAVTYNLSRKGVVTITSYEEGPNG